MIQNKGQGKEEIRWSSTTTYIDIKTGEVLTKEEVQRNYIKKQTKKHTHVYKQTGRITFTVECERTIQGKLFD